MEIELYLLEAEEYMQKAIEHFGVMISRISVGRANPQILNSVKVEYYDQPTAINQVANILIPEPRQLLIKPFEKNLTKNIVSAINSSSIGLSAIDEGDQARINFPELTSDKRKDYVKKLKEYTEAAKVGIRQARQNAIKGIKNDEELSDDLAKDYQEKVQKLTDRMTNLVNDRTKSKEVELTTV